MEQNSSPRAQTAVGLRLPISPPPTFHVRWLSVTASTTQESCSTPMAPVRASMMNISAVGPRARLPHASGHLSPPHERVLDDSEARHVRRTTQTGSRSHSMQSSHERMPRCQRMSLSPSLDHKYFSSNCGIARCVNYSTEAGHNPYVAAADTGSSTKHAYARPKVTYLGTTCAQQRQQHGPT